MRIQEFFLYLYCAFLTAWLIFRFSPTEVADSTQVRLDLINRYQSTEITPIPGSKDSIIRAPDGSVFFIDLDRKRNKSVMLLPPMPACMKDEHKEDEEETDDDDSDEDSERGVMPSYEPYRRFFIVSLMRPVQ